MKFRPLHDRVVIKRIEAEEKTSGGIIIPDTAKEKPQEGEVIAALLFVGGVMNVLWIALLALLARNSIRNIPVESMTAVSSMRLRAAHGNSFFRSFFVSGIGSRVLLALLFSLPERGCYFWKWRDWPLR